MEYVDLPIVVFAVIVALYVVRMIVVSIVRDKAINRIGEINRELLEAGLWLHIDYAAVGDPLDQLLSLRKWTFKQFYPYLVDK